jgi:DNA-binding transcriptional MerR regulator
MRIGELARQAGVSPAAIRFYERSSVLPEPARTAAGYRDYDEHAAELLQFIRAGQAVGLGLAELAEVIAFRQRGQAVPCAHVLELITTHAARVDDQINQLRRLRQDLQTLVDRAEQLDPADCSPESVCHLIADPRHPGKRSGYYDREAVSRSMMPPRLRLR